MVGCCSADMTRQFLLPDIPEAEKTPLVVLLLGIIEQQNIVIQELEARITVLESELKKLKGQNQRPKISPSKMDKGDPDDQNGDADHDHDKKLNKNHKHRSKIKDLPIDEEVIVFAESVPEGAQFKGYADFIVQDLIIRKKTTKYRLARWILPDGTFYVAKLPESLRRHHFGPALRTFLVSQYYCQHVTQPELLKLLHSWGIDISAGQLSNILTKDKEEFHQEKEDILAAGLESSSQINVDDTGARHQGKNGFCTHIGNELFAWFSSTASKSRINFLTLLRQAHNDFVLDDNAMAYCETQKLPAYVMAIVKKHLATFQDENAFEAGLRKMGISRAAHIKVITEAALVGSILSHGFKIDYRIMSDDAGQFNIFKHALCWIHAERKIKALQPLSKKQSKQFDTVLHDFWEIYNDLKAYKKTPEEMAANRIREKFDRLCLFKTDSLALQKLLKKLAANRTELLLALDYPDLPLHNNLSERDIREYVRMRKTNGSTRSEDGRRCRDTFASIKKTCLKLQVNLWDFLLDRHTKSNQILRLPDLIKLRAISATTVF